MEINEAWVQKKPWEPPNLVIFGDINSLTQQIKPKHLGDADDFATNPGVSTAP
ncbi:MAG: hypothetical protein HOP17_00435 [Acidobacteria bacterium]|nr:hypothetical protein [Acidobacteriota bacterium]